MIKTLKDIIGINKIDIEIPTGKINVEYAKNILENLNKIKEDEKIKFVYGKGKRKSYLQKHIENFI